MEGKLHDPYRDRVGLIIGIGKLLALPLPQPFSRAEFSVTMTCTACTHHSDASDLGLQPPWSIQRLPSTTPYGVVEMPHSVGSFFLSDALKWKAVYATLMSVTT